MNRATQAKPKAKKAPARDTARGLYSRQNVTIHKALGELGLVYVDNRNLWADVMSEMFKRPVTSIKHLTLGERSRFIGHLIQRGARTVTNPWVPGTMMQWRAGDDDVKGVIYRPLRVPHEKRPTVRKIAAILADMKLPWEYADKIARQSHGIQYVEWLEYEAMRAVMQMLIIHQRRRANGGRSKANG